MVAGIMALTMSGCSGWFYSSDVLRVMQFNIKVGDAASVSGRVEGLKTIVKKYNPDVIGFQEVNPAWREQLDGAVFDSKWTGIGEVRAEGEEATPIYFRNDRFELLDSGTFWLSETPDVFGSKMPDANYARVATWVKLKNLQNGKVFVHINTHLDHNGNNDSKVGNAIREAQTKVLMRFAYSQGDVPMILTGDFNQTMTSSKGTYYAPYQLITGMQEFELEDGSSVKMDFKNTRLTAADTVDEDKIATMTRYFDVNNEKYYDPSHQPIDYVFYSAGDFTALLYSSFMPTVKGVDVSDHLGLYCELKY